MAKDKAAGQVMLIVATSVPSLVVRISLSYLRMKRQANRSARQFYLSLVKNGMPKREARQLADEFASAFSLSTMMKQVRPFGRASRP